MDKHYEKVENLCYLVGMMSATIKQCINLIDVSDMTNKEYHANFLKNRLERHIENFHLINSHKFKKNEQI